MANSDATELLDKHIKENTANGNMHPGENWYEKDYREAEDLVWAFTDLDWHSLKKIFEERSHVWQEACVFVLGESGAKGSVKMLTDIFINGEDKIACYVGIFISDQDLLEFGDEERSAIYKRAEELLSNDKYKKFGEHYRVTLDKIVAQLK